MALSSARRQSELMLINGAQKYLGALYTSSLIAVKDILTKNLTTEEVDREAKSFKNNNLKEPSKKFHRKINSYGGNKLPSNNQIPKEQSFQEKSIHRKTNSVDTKFQSLDKPFIKHMKIVQNLDSHEKAQLLLQKLDNEKKSRAERNKEKLKSQENSILNELNTLAREKEIMKKAFEQEKKKQIESRISVAQQIRTEREKQEQETKIVLKKILTTNKHIIRGTQSAKKSRDVINNSMNTHTYKKLLIPKTETNKSLSFERKIKKSQLPPLASDKKSIHFNVTKKSMSNVNLSEGKNLKNSIIRMKDKIEYLESLVNDGK